jgi:hypothetical protein
MQMPWVMVERHVQLMSLFAEQLFRALVRFEELLPLGDVLVGRHPAAAVEGLVDNAHQASAAALDGQAGRCPRGNGSRHLGAILLDIAKKRTALFSMNQKFAKRQAGLHDRGRNSVQFHIAAIAQGDALVRIEHHQALRHVANGGVELSLRLVDLLLLL